MTVRFSVFIPVWNDADWLPGAIESLLGQSHGAWELVIGDNASTDDLAAVVARYPDRRVRYHRWATHTDLCENFNRTMLLCRREWVQPLCADDRLDPRCLAVMAARIEETSDRTARLAMAITAARRVRRDGRPAEEAYYGYRGRAPVPDGLHDAASWLRYTAAGVPPWNIGSVAFARDVLAEMGGFLRAEIGLCADVDLALRAAAYGDVLYVDEPLLDYTVRIGADSQSRGLTKRAWDASLTSMGAALLSGLRVHEERREVSEAERVVVSAAVARSQLQRAFQHRYLPGGRGRRGAVLDVARATSHSPRAVLSPKNLGYGLAAILVPQGMLMWARAAVLTHQYSGPRPEGRLRVDRRSDHVRREMRDRSTPPHDRGSWQLIGSARDGRPRSTRSS